MEMPKNPIERLIFSIIIGLIGIWLLSLVIRGTI